MASGRKIVVEFLGNASDLNRAMDDSARRGGRFGAALKKAGKVAALGLAAGAVIAGKALVDMTKAAIEDEKAQQQLANQLRKAAGATDEQIASIEDYISAQGRALGVADDDMRPALAKLATATGDVTKAQDLMNLALDAAAGSGKSLEQVTDALVRAQNGSVGGLSRLGVATKNAAGETLSFAEIQKAMAEKYHGAAATAAETTAGKMARLKLVLAETGEEIGAKLIPVVTAMADWFLTKGLPAIEKFGGWLQNNLGPIFTRIGETVRGLFGSGTSGEISSNLGKIQEIIGSVVSIIQSLWETFGGTILTYTLGTFDNLKQIIGGALNVIAGIFKVISSVLKGDWSGAWEGIKQIIGGALDVILGVVKQFGNLVKAAFSIIWTAVREVVSAAWDGIEALVGKGADAVVEGIKAIPGRIKGLAESFGEAGRAVIDAMVNGLKNAAGVIEGIAGNVWSAVKGLLNAAIDKINAALEFKISLPGPDITVNPPNIPHLAKGGVVRKPTLALIGEDGPEAVVPLGKKNAPKGGLGLPGAAPVQITVVSWDPAQAGRAVVDALRKYERLTGATLLASPA